MYSTFGSSRLPVICVVSSSMLSWALPAGVPGLGVPAVGVEPGAGPDGLAGTRFADVCAGFGADAGFGVGVDAGAGVDTGSGDDVCVADVLTPGSKSDGGGATLDLVGGAGLPWPLLCAQAVRLQADTAAMRAPCTRRRAIGCLSVRTINLPPLELARLPAPRSLVESLQERLPQASTAAYPFAAAAQRSS
jgi:hypothetical protein